MNADFVIMGLPESGKTTFLAALWHVIESDEIECRLKLGAYRGDVTYLNAIAQAWRTFQKVPRTSQTGDRDVLIPLIDSRTNIEGDAFFPDLAGETFDAQVELRRSRPGFIARVAEDDGLLLFIKADATQENLSIVEFNKMLPPEPEANEAAPLTTDPAIGDVATETSAKPKAIEWTPKKTLAQVRLVQILSDLLRPPFAQRRRRLAIILSAWDLARATGLSPDDWISRNMPLLHQFLRSNAQSFDKVIFGVSAQGVSLTDRAGVLEVSALPASSRITVVGPVETEHDITAPLSWLMSIG